MEEGTKIILGLVGYAVSNGIVAIILGLWLKQRVANEKDFNKRMSAGEKLLVKHDEKIYTQRKDFDELKKEHKENHKWGG